MAPLTTTEDYVTAVHARLSSYNPTTDRDKTASILGALLLHSPSERGRINVATDIISAVDNAAMKALANGSEPSSRSPVGWSLESLEENPGMLDADQLALKQVVCPSPCRYESSDNSRLRSQNSTIIDILSRKGKMVFKEDRKEFEYTDAAHIISVPFAPNSEKRAEASAFALKICRIYRTSEFLEILEQFGRFDRLEGIDINHIDNMMTLTVSAHAAFGRLRIWLEAMQASNIPIIWILARVTVN
ncbi:hypothetical protein DFS33DRAFT_1275126 [Desarmillaria ectypa]|nr:hypothetical protein DFS33DRAFT_1275126 [Desarmillaria ectypa]